MSSDVHYFSPTTPGASSFDVDVSGLVRLGRIGPLSGEAQMAAVGSGSVTLDDEDSTAGHDNDGILGLKQWYWDETACPVGNQRVFTAYTFDRNYQRGDSLVTGAARQIDVTLMDPNAFLSFRIFPPEEDDPTSSFNRPAEDSIDRIQALLAVDFLSTTLFDLGYIPTTGGKPMDAHDYTGSKPFDVVNDIAQVMQWNPWVGYDETENKLFLWFDDWRTDGSATVPYDSTLRLTNVQSEEDATTLLVEKWPVENVDPSRVISAVRVMGKGKNVYRTRPTTAYTFGWRDAVMEAQYLSDEAKLIDLAETYLTANATEDHRITVSVQVPASLVTAIHEGMRIQAHFTHCPSTVLGFTWCRILHRTVRRDQETSAFYWLDLELSPIVSTATDVYWLSFLTQRASGGPSSAIVPRSYITACGDGSPQAPWTYLEGGFVQGGPQYPFDVAYQSGPFAYVINDWGGPGGLGGGSRPTGYHFQLAGCTGPPVYMDKISNQVPATTFTAPTVIAPDDGWLLCLFSGRKDGDAAVTYTNTTAGATLVDQLYAQASPSTTFSPKSAMLYKPVSASDSVTFTISASTTTEWGAIVIFVPGDISIFEYQATGSGGSSLCWTWASLP